jgi:xylulokinase
MESRTGKIPEESGDLFLGIDIGTTNCKVALGDRHGRISCRTETPCILEYPKQGWVEADPENGWWIPLLRCLKELLEETGTKGDSIRGIGVSCTNALVCLGQDGKPVLNAIMQLDRRTTREAEAMADIVGEEETFRITGNRIAPGTFSAPSILWVKNQESGLIEKISSILSPAGYITFRLTGEKVMDQTRAATTLLYDLVDGIWSDKITGLLGISGDILPPIQSPCRIAGEVSEEAAALTGLKAGTPVTAGAMDSVAAAVGMGTTSPGKIGIILGTVGRVLWTLDRPAFDNRFLNVPLHEPDKWMSIACTNGTGLSVNWFSDNLMGTDDTLSHAEILGLMDSEASESPPGSNGIIYLPFLAGERSPVWDPYARGVFFGLDISHTRGDLARAIMEGTAFSISDNLEILESVTGVHPETILVSGGGSRSPLWPRLLSSVLGRDIHISQYDDSECSGAIILAAISTGSTGIREVPPSLPGSDETISSGNNNESRLYDDLFSQYRDIYQDLKKHFRQLHDTILRSDSKEEPQQ